MTAAMHLGIAMQGNAMHGDVTQDMTFDEVRTLLNLEPNATCGYVRITFESPLRIEPGGCRRHSRMAGRPARLSTSC